MALSVQNPYTNISPKTWEHPADRAATAALQRIPLLDSLVRTLIEWRYERSMMQNLLGNAVRCDTRQLPALWRQQEWVHAQLDLPAVTSLYVTQAPLINAATLGARRPAVLVWSGLISALDEAEQTAVLAHEAAHVLSEHIMYRTALQILLDTSLRPVPALGRLPLRALELALLEWARATELSCDRAAALVMRDPMVVCRVQMKSAGGGLAGMDVDAFLQQAEEYADVDDIFLRRQQFLSMITTTHPSAVRRVNELVRWVRSGDYDRIRNGDWVQRGQEPPVTAAFSSAVEHYSKRFVEAVESTGVGLQQLGTRLREAIDALRERLARGDADDDEVEEEPPPKPRARKR